MNPIISLKVNGKGLALGAGSFGGFMLVCGFFLLKKNIPGWWIWAHYMSFEKYGFEALMVSHCIFLERLHSFKSSDIQRSQKNEFAGEMYPCNVQLYNVTINGVKTPVPECQCAYPDLNRDCQNSGEEILTFYEYQNVQIWEWAIVLFGMAVIFRILFYLLLRFANKGKR